MTYCIFHVSCYFKKKNHALRHGFTTLSPPSWIPIRPSFGTVDKFHTSESKRKQPSAHETLLTLDRKHGPCSNGGLGFQALLTPTYTKVLTFKNCSMLLHYPQSNISIFGISLPRLMTCLIRNTTIQFSIIIEFCQETKSVGKMRSSTFVSRQFSE